MNILDEIGREQLKTEVPKFNVGDTVRVHFRIVEGEKERIQVFEGVVISRKGGVGPLARFTVRRVAYNEGVERVFPLHRSQPPGDEYCHRRSVGLDDGYGNRDRARPRALPVHPEAFGS